LFLSRRIATDISYSFLAYYLPLLLYAGAVLVLTTGLLDAGITLHWVHSFFDSIFPELLSRPALFRLNRALWKVGHVTAYGIFTWLVWRVLRRQAAEAWRWLWSGQALVVVALVGGLDELRQSLDPARTPRASDVGWDLLGALLALLLLYGKARRAKTATAPSDAEA
jgi:VanZ family protein